MLKRQEAECVGGVWLVVAKKVDSSKYKGKPLESFKQGKRYNLGFKSTLAAVENEQ